MVKNHFFSQKTNFFRPKNIFFMKNILWGHITINIFASNGENPFLVKNGKKGRHGFVKSSHGCQGNDITHIFCVKHNT